MTEEKTIYSTHHFIFSFRWDFLPKEKTINQVDFDKRTDFDEIDKLLKDTKWEGNKKLQKEDFNHYTYFYEFVRNSLYDFKDNNKIVRYYEYDLSGKSDEYKKYKIEYLEKKKGAKTYTETDYDTKELVLEINGVTMFLFNTGVGTISFDLSNTLKEQNTKEAVLKINELGRRIYPQFLNFSEKKGENENNFLFNAQRVFFNKSITLFGKKEDYDYYNSSNFKILKPIKLPSFITNLFTDKFVMYEDEEKHTNRVRIKPITDDRMFFISWYGNKEFSSCIGEQYKNSDWWYSYIFGDKTSPSLANENLKKEQIEDHTYKRWSGYGTLYGMSRDSFVCLSSCEKYMIETDLPNLKEHQSSIYYQIAILCIVQRASVLKFSSEVSRIADVAKGKNPKLTNEIENLYANYIEFRNKIYFREVTSQIQGIEIYEKFQNVMNIHNDVKDLDSEIEELSNFSNLSHQRKEAAESKKHTLLATIFLPTMLISGILGMNIFDNSEKIPTYFFNLNPILSFWIPTLIIFLITLIFIKWDWIKNKLKKH